GTAVAFVDAGDDAAADEVFAFSTHPFGTPTGEIPAHQRHFTESVLMQSDHPDPPPVAGRVWTDGVATTTSDALEHMIRPAAADAAGVDGGEADWGVDGAEVECRAWDGSVQALAEWLSAWAGGRCVTVTVPE